MITGSVSREISYELRYMAKRICEMKIKFPMTKAPNPEGVRRFARDLKKRLILERSTMTFSEVKLRWPWRDTVEFLKYHGLESYIEEIENYHSNMLLLNNKEQHQQ